MWGKVEKLTPVWHEVQPIITAGCTSFWLALSGWQSWHSAARAEEESKAISAIARKMQAALIVD